MPLLNLFLGVNLLQGLGMLYDEAVFHHKREIPKWERIGHPLDTLTAILVFTALAWMNPAYGTPWWFYLLVGFSCLFVTKDEWVHQKLCTAGEHWLHSLLFVIHPVVFFLAWKTWKSFGFTWVHQIQLSVLILFFSYQAIYWNYFKKKKVAPSINNKIYNDLGDRWYTSKDDPVALLRAETKAKTPWTLNVIQKRFPDLKPSEIAILDVGCGAGFLTNSFSKKGFLVTGIDLSESSLEVAKKYDESNNAKYMVADAARLPFVNESFHVVTCMDFLEHVESPEKVIREASRVLKPGGVFIFHTFNRNWLSHLIIIKGVEWFVKNTPKDLHVIDLFLKPIEVNTFCVNAGLSEANFTGIAPRIFSLPFLKLLFSKEVDPDFSFKTQKSLALAYLGYSNKYI